MPTLKQQALAKNLTDALGAREIPTKKELMIKSGYSEINADKHTKEVFSGKGFEEALVENGFTEENAKSVIQEILLDKRKKDSVRMDAAREIFKVFGTYAPEKKAIVTQHIQSNPELEAIANEYEEKVKAKLKEQL